MRAKGPLRGFLSLLGLLTVLPTPRSSIEDAAPWFWMVPLVGLVRGAIVSLGLLLLPLLPSPLVAVALVALHYVVQGFLHSDGFMDMSEAALVKRFGGDPRAVLEDPRRGSYAIASFGLLLAFLVASSSGSLGMARYTAFAAAELVQAEAMAFTLAYGSPEPYSGMARPIKSSFGLRQLAASYVLFAAASYLLAPSLPMALGLLAAPIAIGALSAALAERVLGYVNGDSLGFAGELAFAAALAMMAYAV